MSRCHVCINSCFMQFLFYFILFWHQWINNKIQWTVNSGIFIYIFFIHPVQCVVEMSVCTCMSVGSFFVFIMSRLKWQKTHYRWYIWQWHVAVMLRTVAQHLVRLHMTLTLTNWLYLSLLQNNGIVSVNSKHSDVINCIIYFI